MGVGELNKPAGSWCEHCTPGRGCEVYQDRPLECREFRCLWLAMSDWGPVDSALRPDRSKAVFTVTAEDHEVVATLDKGYEEEALTSTLVMDLLRKAIARDGKAHISMGGKVTTVTSFQE